MADNIAAGVDNGKASTGNHGSLSNDSHGNPNNNDLSLTMAFAISTASSVLLLTPASLPATFQKTGHRALSNKAREPFSMEAT